MAAGVWFRKGLRLDDNPALAAACAAELPVVPFYILDPHFVADEQKVGAARLNFLLEALADLDAQLAQKGSRLLVLRGKPEEVLPGLLPGKAAKKGLPQLKRLFWEVDTEPYAVARDTKARELAEAAGVACEALSGHTLLDLAAATAAKGFKAPSTMQGIETLVTKHGVPRPIAAPSKVPALPVKFNAEWAVPKFAALRKGAAPPPDAGRLFPGGEREAQKRMKAVLADTEYVCKFEKPKTSSTGRPGKPWEPSTTGLSPYLKFGCLSAKRLYWSVQDAIKGKTHSQPPMSLIGQLLFREMFYTLGATVPHWDLDKGNAKCRPIPWGKDEARMKAWAEGRTGYPYIDALMRQLATTGWMHHLGRHAVACFLTRGDLWQHWTYGRDVFDRLLLDADWSINNGNWLWLAGVAPFSMPYFRVYDPMPKKESALNAEQTGEFVKHFCPELKKMPAKYIYTPWQAPLEVQKAAGCIIGKNYPKPIVEHAAARNENLSKFGAALKGGSAGYPAAPGLAPFEAMAKGAAGGRPAAAAPKGAKAEPAARGQKRPKAADTKAKRVK